MNLDDLSDFVLVAHNGGFAQASRTSGRPKASLSRKVMDLESSLGLRLFDRSARSIQLTQEGEALLKSTNGPLNEITEAIDKLRDGQAHPQGRLRINVPSLFGLMLMGRLAAPSLIQQLPIPVVVRNADRSTSWQIGGTPGREIQTQPVLKLPAFTMIRDAVLTGIGAAKLPRMLVEKDLADGRLVSWGAVSGESAEIWALHTSRRFASAKVKAFMQFLKTAFPHA